MRRTLTTLSILALAGALLAAPATAQTLEEVIDQMIEARGGAEAIAAVESATVTGTMTMAPGMDAPFTLEWKRPNLMRTEFTLQGQTGVQAYDGETGWMHMPFLGKAEPERMPAEESARLGEQADIFEGPLVDWQEKGHEVTLVGKEEVEGTEMYNVEVKLSTGDVVNIFIDADLFLEIRHEGKITRGDQVVEVVTTFGNYKQVDGLVIPFSVESKPKDAPPGTPGQVMTIESVEFGTEIDDSRFAFPEPEPAAEAAAESGS